MSCVFQEAKVVNEHGDLDYDKMISHFQQLDKEFQTIGFNMARKCLRAKGDTQCERAFWYHQCWKKADPKVIHKIKNTILPCN